MSFLRHGRSTSHHGSNHGHDWTIPDPGGLGGLKALAFSVVLPVIPVLLKVNLDHHLTGAKRREWMGCWGNGMIIDSDYKLWIIPENSLRLAPVREATCLKLKLCSQYFPVNTFQLPKPDPLLAEFSDRVSLTENQWLQRGNACTEQCSKPGAVRGDMLGKKWKNQRERKGDI